MRCDVLLKTQLCPKREMHHTFFARKNKDRRSLLGEQGCGGLCDIERMERMAEITSRPHR